MLVTIVLVSNEILFWVLVAAGLIARYRLGRKHLGATLLAAAPLVDLVLLTVSVIDLRSGAHAHLAHVLAAIYIGVSVGFGHRMIAWADVRYAHRHAGGPAPEPKPARGTPERAAHERAGWMRHLLAWAVGTGLMGLAIGLVGDAERTAPFANAAQAWTVVLLIDAAFSWWPTVERQLPGASSARRETSRLDGA